MKKGNRRFESEVHLGLLVIVCILLFLNLTSNFIIYRARESMRRDVLTDLSSAARAATRMVQGTVPLSLTETQQRQIRLQYALSGVMVIPSQPHDSSMVGRGRWFSAIVRELPSHQVPDLARKLLASDYKSLTRGNNDEYFFVSPITAGSGRSLLVVSKNSTTLAYLDDSARMALIIAAVSALAIAGIYLLLSRFIFSPFRKIRQQARAAGRSVGEEEDDVEAMVVDYQKIIDELKEKETELLKLNKIIQKKADSLEQFNQFLLTSMNSGLITIDREGRILSVNRAAGEILDVESSEFQGKLYSKALGIDGQLAAAIRQTLSRGEKTGYQEIEYPAADKQNLVLGISVSVISDEGRRPIGASLLINDLTELRRLRTELETSNRLAALGEMAAGLAHQLRNSMGAISGYCGLMKKRLKKTGQDTDNISALTREITETEQLVNRFLQFAGPLAFRPEPQSINELIAETVTGLQARPESSRIELVIEETVETTLEVDPLLLKQALTNILENALNSYENQPGRVEVRLVQRDEELDIVVSDRGCGIADENLDKIFTPFYSSRPSGTGLGLPLARKIIDMHRGTLKVRSQPGEGTTFVITLPHRRQPIPTPA
ncbi:MAG: ATP-binding protein [bacterium]